MMTRIAIVVFLLSVLVHTEVLSQSAGPYGMYMYN